MQIVTDHMQVNIAKGSNGLSDAITFENKCLIFFMISEEPESTRNTLTFVDNFITTDIDDTHHIRYYFIFTTALLTVPSTMIRVRLYIKAYLVLLVLSFYGQCYKVMTMKG